MKKKRKMAEVKPTVAKVREKLREMYRTLLSGEDRAFFKVQSWVFELSESPLLAQYPEDLQQDILGCVDQYRIEHRLPADRSYPGGDYKYFLPF